MVNVLDGYFYMGDRVWYSGGGYMVWLWGNVIVLRNKFIELEKEGWVDCYICVIFVEFIVYNLGINFFGIVILLLEVSLS